MTFSADDFHIKSCKTEGCRVDLLAKPAIVTVGNNNTLGFDVFFFPLKKKILVGFYWVKHKFVLRRNSDSHEYFSGTCCFSVVVWMYLLELRGWKAHCFTPSLLKRLQPVGGVKIKGSNLNHIVLFSVWSDALFLGLVGYFMGRNEKCAVCCVQKDPPRNCTRGNRLHSFLFSFFFFSLEGFTPQPSFWLNHFLVFKPTVQHDSQWWIKS